MLKVRFVTRKWPPAVGGMETYSVRLTEELAHLCDLQTVALPGRADGAPPGIAALLAFGLGYPFRLKGFGKVDVAHLGDMALWPLGLLERVFGKASTLAISAHGSDVSLARRPGLKAALYRWYLRLGSRMMKGVPVIANSAYIAELASGLGFDQVRVVPLGTDMAPVPAGQRRDLLFVGRISRGKGLRFLVEKVLPGLDSPERLRVAGTVWEDSERELLKDPRVEFLGALTPAELREEYSRAAVTLVPSQIAEGFGLVAIEAAACGSQVVASNAGGLAEVVREPWGDAVSPTDAGEWQVAITRRLEAEDPAMQSVSEAAIGDVDRNYRWPTAAQRTLQAYLR